MVLSLATIAGLSEDPPKDLLLDPIPTVVSGARGNAESGDSAKMYGSAAPPATPASLPTPPVTQPISLMGKCALLAAALIPLPVVGGF